MLPGTSGEMLHEQETMQGKTKQGSTHDKHAINPIQKNICLSDRLYIEGKDNRQTEKYFLFFQWTTKYRSSN